MFKSGQIVMTAGVNEKAAASRSFSKFIIESLQRHLAQDWGDLPPEDKKENELALEQGFRLFSSYLKNGDKIWIITEADRSATTILFPNEY